MASRLCGEPLRTIMWESRYCARPAGHAGSRHRSAAALEAARRRAAAQPPTGSPVVAATIRQAREQAAMSRPRLAAAMGVTATAVQLWEQGKRTPSGENWVQLELALGPLGVVRGAVPRPEAPQESSDVAA
jgi:DNA-binding transcriptional regulator YiaG